MNNYCTFYIVRHGQSITNVLHILSGHSDDELSQVGIEQARSRANDLRSVHFDAAFSSDLMRANRTASIIAQEHKIAVTALKILRERYYGSIQGQSATNLPDKLKKSLDDYNAMSYKDRLTVKLVPDMESDEEVIGRFTTFLRETAVAYTHKTILVVAHGNLLRTFLVHVGFGTHQELAHNTVLNTGYFILKSDGVDFEVVKTVGIEKKISHSSQTI